MDIKRVDKADALPDEWDETANEYFQTKTFLAFAEKYNPCEQRYYMLSIKDRLLSGAVCYTLRLDLLTYLAIKSPIRMTIVGIPCSVSCPGIIGQIEHFPILFDFITKHETGLILLLNLDSIPDVSNAVVGRTLPTILLSKKFESWDHYTMSMRSHYKRRIHVLSLPFSDIQMSAGSCTRFDAEMYNQYLDVLKRSAGRLETLSLEFFQNLPSDFYLMTYYNREDLLGWTISILFKGKYSFFLGGINYDLVKQFNTYFNMLFAIIRDGIAKKATSIDLGQTAEIPKICLGGNVVEKNMLAYHKNRLLRIILKSGKRFLEYHRTVPDMHVFRKSI